MGKIRILIYVCTMQNTHKQAGACALIKRIMMKPFLAAPLFIASLFTVTFAQATELSGPINQESNDQSLWSSIKFLVDHPITRKSGS